MRLTEEEYKDLCSRMGKPLSTLKQVSLPDKKESKYHNRKTEYIDPETGETIFFDSVKERDYYINLKALEMAGEVIGIKRQVPLLIQPDFIDPNGKKVRAIKYIADFTYLEVKKSANCGTCYIKHYVDVKGFKTDVYKLKKKLLAYQGIVIEEV